MPRVSKANASKAALAAKNEGKSNAAAPTLAPDYAPPAIDIRNARTNNLRGVSVNIPQGTLTVVTGLSGSGKSSLAFDTLFAEGRRRFLQSLSTYARQFLDKLKAPEVDSIDHLPPAIALEQKNHVTNARSTVATATELLDYLRLVFARVSDVVCPTCELPVFDRTAGILADEWNAQPDGTQVVITAPIKLTDPALAGSLAESLRVMGFSRLWRANTVLDLDTFDPKDLSKDPAWNVIVERLVVRADDDAIERRGRLAQAADTAFRVGRQSLVAVLGHPRGEGKSPRWAEETIAAGPRCAKCGTAYRRPEPELFSYHSALGACKLCSGYGRIVGIDWDKVLPNYKLSILEGAIAPWRGGGYRDWFDELCAFCRAAKIPLHQPFAGLTSEQHRWIREGKGGWVGIRGFFDALQSQPQKMQNRITVARYRSYEPCPDCHGSRLNPITRAYRFGGQRMDQLLAMPIADARKWFDEVDLKDVEKVKASRRLLIEIRSRLRYLDDVGLGYLTLSRQTRTLSGGESQRINLATALGSALTDTLYVLDEPTVGLHARDSHRLLGILHGLRDNGNTVVVVEHDKDIIRGADRVIDIGPQAGERGGQLMFDGTISDLLALPARNATATSTYLKTEKTAVFKPADALRNPRGWIGVKGARANNLKNLSVRFPLGVLACLTGVSGSGKSTLVRDILFAGWQKRAQSVAVDVGAHDDLSDWAQIEDMTFVDQTPLGRSTRSNAVTYTGAWEEIRRLMASTDDAKRLGVMPRDFSFNVAGGRCEACEGTGLQAIDLHFLGEVNVECETCSGKRFKDHILSIKFRGQSIDDLLKLTLTDAFEFFKDDAKCREGLRPLIDVGLGYLRLGQSTATLSGGELQRLKLATYLGDNAAGPRRLLIFDEPTTGLHPADLDQLVNVFDRLVDQGYSILVVEHNLDLIARTDWVIDLGPEGGDGGGSLVYEGAPRGLLKNPESHTGRALLDANGA